MPRLLLVQQRQLLLRAHVLELGVDEALPQHLMLRQQPLNLVWAWCMRGAYTCTCNMQV